MSETIVILNNIRSSHNVGSIFRTSDALGVSKIYLIGFTPCPLDRFKRPNKDIAKTALGAEQSIPWETREEVLPLLSELKKEGFQIIAIEQSEQSVDYKMVVAHEKTAFLLGSEVGGLSKEILDECGIVAEIRMLGKKESLNVSVAAGVAMFRILKI